ncbi:hypothetical protein MMC21_002981, partial [Puttea exsequens]|nr:hypothetical protein [Puttea exsequens]
MSFFHEVSTPFNKTKDPRVKAWGQGEISTAATPGYEKKAKDAQAAASNATSKSSIQGGKIVKAVHADNPRPSLPSNVRGLHNVNTGDDGSDVDCLPERGRLPNDAHSRGTRKDERSAWAKGPRQTTTQQPRANKKTPKWSVLDLSSMVERDDNASSLKTYENPPACSLAQATVADYAVKTCLPPASTTSQKNMTSVKNSATAPVHAQSFASRASEKAPAVPQQFSSITTASSSLPPHMRPPPKIKPSEDTFAASAVQPIKSRKAAKSAKHN